MSESADNPSARATVLHLDVRSTDIDGDGIVNNAVFYEYCEQSRLKHLFDLGVNRPERGGRPYERRFTIVETRCRYHAPAGFRDTLRVETRTVKVGTKSFVLAYRIFRDHDGAFIAEGESVQVWLDAGGQSSAPLPGDIRARLEASLDSEAAME